MNTLLRFLTIVVVLLSAPLAGAQSTDSSDSRVTSTACNEPAGESGRGTPPISIAPAAGPPSGLTFAVLADQSIEQWPLRASGLILTLRHLTLDSGVVSESRRAAGPLVFYVEMGTVGISINSQMEYFEAGASVLVQDSQRYVLRNASSAAASVLRVEVVPPGEETEVAFGDPVEVREDQAAAPGPPFIASRLLLTGEIPAIEGKTHLILGCLSWTDPAADPGEIAHSGPVGYLVLRGQMLVGETGIRVAGECVVFQAEEAHRLRAGEPPPVVLVVAAMPDEAQLWGAQPVGVASGASTDRLKFECGEHEDTNVETRSTGTSDNGRRRAQV
jgi:hypothetical protein